MAERYWQTKTRNIVIPIPNAVNIEPRCMVEKELAESDAWLLSMVLPLTAELLGLGNRFEEPYIEDKEGKKLEDLGLKVTN